MELIMRIGWEVF